ncbi:MAG: FHA domain-containing protein [Armatimonadetes bacterium]|nr:FHA domain-containing protein [Armatimonadota bacterium]
MDNRTLINPPGGERTQVVPPAGDRTQVVSPPASGDRTQMGVALTCPVCDTQNAGGTEWCGECGFRLDAAPGETPSPDQARPPAQLTDERGNAYPLYPGVSTLGRQDTTVLIQDPTVSRRHARITLDEGGLRIEDLDSSNGTTVDGERLNPGEPKAIHDGATIQVGSVSLKLEVNEAISQAAEEGPPSETSDAPLEDPELLGAAVEIEREALHGQAGDASYVEESLIEDGTEEVIPEEGALVGPRLLLPDGTAFDLPDGATTVGRRNTNDLVLPDAYTSGAHAQVIREGNAVRVVDQDSTNGTFVNGNRLPPGEPTTLSDGDVIRFGQTEATLSLPNETADSGG